MYKVFNRIYGERIECEDLLNLMRYARKLRKEIPFSELKPLGNDEFELVEFKPSKEEEELIDKLDWCGRDWVKHQIWNGNNTEDKIWKAINLLPEYYFG